VGPTSTFQTAKADRFLSALNDLGCVQSRVRLPNPGRMPLYASLWVVLSFSGILRVLPLRRQLQAKTRRPLRFPRRVAQRAF